VIFSVVYPVLVAPLPYPSPNEIVVLNERSPDPEGQTEWVSPPTFRDWRERSRHLKRVASYQLNLLTWTGGTEPRMLNGWAVSSSYFQIFRVAMALGRGFTEQEDGPAGERVVVLSDALWQQQFGSNPSVLGRVITLNGVPYTIIGVASPLIDFPARGDCWVPAAIDYGGEMRDFRYLGVIARLQTGSSLEDARAELAGIARQIESEHPETNTGWGVSVRTLYDVQVGRAGSILTVMSAAVGLLLLIAIGNTANLAIARSSGRQADAAVRSALGASGAALVRMYVGEAVVVALAAAGLGLVIAVVCTRALAVGVLFELPRVAAIVLDSRCVLFALGAAVVIGTILGLLSAKVSGTGNVNEAMRAGGPSSTVPTRAHRLREAVSTVQVALALVLLVGASLLAETLWNLGRVDVGFSVQDLVTFGFNLPDASYPDPEARRAFYRDVRTLLCDAPGIAAAGFVTPIPMEMGSVPTSWSLSGAVSDPDDRTAMAHMRVVTPGYLEAMGIRLLAGRFVDEGDREDAEQVTVVNEAFVNRYLRGHDPLGVRISPGDPDPDESGWIVIVGVVGDVRFHTLTDRGEPEIYIPMAQFPSAWGHVVVRGSVPRERIIEVVTDAVHRVDPDLPLASVKSGQEIVERQLRMSRLNATVTSLFALLASMLAVAGVLGVLSIAVTQRIKEIGLRIVLGAQPSSIWRYVVFRGMRPVVAGLAVGLVVALAATRFLESQIYGVGALDPFAFTVPTVCFTAAGLLACLVPGSRASAADPVSLLRSE
jgi:predicted permease